MFDIFKKHPEVFIAISERENGSMKLLENIPPDHPNLQNRKIYLRKIGIPLSRLVSAEIIHKNKVAVVSEKDTEKIIAGADGLITRGNNLFLSITIADCLPIFLFDSEKEVIGIVHAGWRSLAEDILFNAIEKIKELGGAPKNILVGIGPAICQKHYEVGPEVAEKFENFPEAIRREDKKTYLDLKKIAQLQLLELGLKGKNIEISSECTYELPEKYFSARRYKPKEIEAMIAVIGLRA